LLAKRRELEAAAVELGEDADRSERAKQPVERIRMRVSLRGELVARARPFGEQVRNLQRDRDVDRLRTW
jgi:hypothetical protein